MNIIVETRIRNIVRNHISPHDETTNKLCKEIEDAVISNIKENNLESVYLVNREQVIYIMFDIIFKKFEDMDFNK